MQASVVWESEYVFSHAGARRAKPWRGPLERETPMSAIKTSHGPRWYVVQVATGKERAICELIERVAPEGSLEECFSPSFETQMKVRGEWVPATKLLFPGYVIAVTNHIEKLEAALRQIPEFTRVLSVGETFVPLHEEDQAWIGAFTKKGARAIPMSSGVMEGDRVVVTSGPLVGREALIKIVNRHKSLAFLEFEICGRVITTKVGLGIVRKHIDDERGSRPESP